MYMAFFSPILLGVKASSSSWNMKAARKPTARQIRKQKAENAVAQRKRHQVDVCTLCLTRVLGPALRAEENRLGRFGPCGCVQFCWSCAFNFAMRQSLYRDDYQPILKEDDLDNKEVRCPGCNTVAVTFEECGPAGTTVAVEALPFRDLSWEERSTLRREPPSAWGRPRATPQLEPTPEEKAEAKAAERGARRSADEQARFSTHVDETEWRRDVARIAASSGLVAALERPVQVRAASAPHAHHHLSTTPSPPTPPRFAGVGSGSPCECRLQAGGRASAPLASSGNRPSPPSASVQPGNATG